MMRCLRSYGWIFGVAALALVGCSGSNGEAGGNDDGGATSDAGHKDSGNKTTSDSGSESGNALQADAGGDSQPSTGAMDSGHDAAPSCTDGVRNGTETDVDCGGSCPPCALGKSCSVAADCATGDNCVGGTCSTETDVGCGGPTAPACGTGETCKVASDCVSLDCSAGKCLAASATDGIQNEGETDVDCGGPNAPGCMPGGTCKVASDCESLDCASGVCLAATSTDGIQNEGETDVDCGGPNAPACGTGDMCKVAGDCVSLDCTGGKCLAATSSDGIQNEGETDVDCGGPNAPPCLPGGTCKVASDCASLDCPAGKCLPATSSDGIQNEGETDIDCGGLNAPACAAGKKCVLGTDCTSKGCNYLGVCATKRSCVYADGGYTCGTGATGTAGAENDDCCAELPITMSSSDPTEPSKTVVLDKYFVTAGRFRAMMDATNGDLQSIVNVTPVPAGWNAAWTSFMPTGLALPTGAYSQLGPYDQDGTGVNGCDLTADGNHSYWMPPGTYPEEDSYYLFDHTVYDRMPMNCAPLYYFAAFCIWDGGRIATVPELQRAWRGPSNPAVADSADATNEYPWGSSANNTDITDHAIDWNDTGRDSPLPSRVYEPSTPPPGQTYVAANVNQGAILPPGRSPTGAGPYGHMDLMGLLLVFPAPYEVGTTWYYDFIGTSDFNNHPLTTNSTVPAAYLKRAVGEYRYWAVGARCVRSP